ncbi:translation initiation factor IF-3 [Brevibacillus reuszeri]|nr:translation initiation factor IF-3 [Brevibacillus reuszeri]KNB73041.1 translation initiation factor IF-3 [Brevibacillus reuszeri]MED1860441.1 translation initiation factor IF-3 [Brevibacillus reuszeri]
MIMNEKIKAEEVQLTGIQGEDLGIVPTKKALQMAKELRVDLVCISLLSSPPLCQLVGSSDYKQQVNKESAKNKKVEKGVKVKEIRLSAFIEDHDYDTKKRQAERILSSGDCVQLIVRLEKKESKEAKQLVEQLVRDLSHCSKQDKGIQVSGKQVIAVLLPN